MRNRSLIGAVAGVAAALTLASTAWAAAPVVSSFTPTAGVVGGERDCDWVGFQRGERGRVQWDGRELQRRQRRPDQHLGAEWGDDGEDRGSDPGGTALSGTVFKVNPKITGFTPASGPVGTGVTIGGSAFTGATALRFNGVGASFGSVSYTSLVATVPAGATSGLVKVTTPGGTATSASAFTVTVAAAAIALTPGSGPPGTAVWVAGTGFGPSEVVDVYFDATPITVALTDGNGGFSGG